MINLLLSLFLFSSPARALEVTSCTAKEIPKTPGTRTFVVRAQLKNETAKKFAVKKESESQGPQVLAGYMLHGDCSAAGAFELGATLLGDIPAKGKGAAAAELGLLAPVKGKSKLVFYMSSDPEGEKEASAMGGANCGFEPRAIRNPKHFKVCTLETSDKPGAEKSGLPRSKRR